MSTYQIETQWLKRKVNTFFRLNSKEDKSVKEGFEGGYDE